VGVIDVTEECTLDFPLIWLEMMAEQSSIRMTGVPRMQDMLTGARWRVLEGLRSLLDVVVVINAPNTEGFDQIRSRGAPIRNSDFVSNTPLGCKISEYRDQFKQGACQSAQSSALRKSSPKVQYMEGQAPVASISLGIDQKLKVPNYPEFCSECSGAKELDFPGPIFARVGFILSRTNSIRGAASLQNTILDDDIPSFGSGLYDLYPRFGAQKSMYREEYGFWSSDSQDEPVGNLIKGPSKSYKNHSATSGKQYIGVLIRGSKLGLDGTKEAPNEAHSEQAGPMNSENDEESIDNSIRGIHVGQLGHPERSVQEDNAYMAAADSGHNRQILARMERIALVEGLLGNRLV
jgi:hypothetical protein